MRRTIFAVGFLVAACSSDRGEAWQGEIEMPPPRNARPAAPGWVDPRFEAYPPGGQETRAATKAKPQPQPQTPMEQARADGPNALECESLGKAFAPLVQLSAPDGHTAAIDRTVWDAVTAEQKRSIAVWAAYCKFPDPIAVAVVDKKTAASLATYTPFSGFKPN
jgi:hypothetical protein